MGYRGPWGGAGGGAGAVDVWIPSGALIDIETRRKAGHDDICALLSKSEMPRNKSQGFGLGMMALNPLAWPSLVVFGYVKVASRLRYRMRKRAGTHKRWIRDETSRAV